MARRLADGVSAEYLARVLPSESDTARPAEGGFSLTIPGEPVSMNNAYVSVGRRRVLSAEGRAFKATVQQAVTLARVTPPPGRLSLRLHFFGRWDTKSGEPRRRDLLNAEKLLSDAIFDALGIDDRWIRHAELRATHAETARIEIRLETMR